MFSKLNFYKILFIFVLNSIQNEMSFQMSCLNEKGVPVDWFIVYKIPKIENSVDKRLSSGFAYTFISEKSIKSSNDWILSELTIDDKDSIFGKTITQVIDNKKGSDVSYVAYNDQKPGYYLDYHCHCHYHDHFQCFVFKRIKDFSRE